MVIFDAAYSSFSIHETTFKIHVIFQMYCVVFLKSHFGWELYTPTPFSHFQLLLCPLTHSLPNSWPPYSLIIIVVFPQNSIYILLCSFSIDCVVIYLGLTSWAWITYHGAHPWRKPNTPFSAAPDCLYLIIQGWGLERSLPCLLACPLAVSLNKHDKKRK